MSPFDPYDPNADRSIPINTPTPVDGQIVLVEYDENWPAMFEQEAKFVREADRAVMLGAFTPTEAQEAYEAGSDFIKIFPADVLGPTYIKAILAPLPHLRIIPTGIAKPDDVTAFIKAGCVGVGLGSLLIPQQALRDGNWAEITRLARQFTGMVSQARQK